MRLEVTPGARLSYMLAESARPDTLFQKRLAPREVLRPFSSVSCSSPSFLLLEQLVGNPSLSGFSLSFFHRFLRPRRTPYICFRLSVYFFLAFIPVTNIASWNFSHYFVRLCKSALCSPPWAAFRRSMLEPSIAVTGRRRNLSPARCHSSSIQMCCSEMP
jgi:hypothetical protein